VSCFLNKNANSHRFYLKEIPEEEVSHWIEAKALELQFNALVSLPRNHIHLNKALTVSKGNISLLATLQVLDLRFNSLQSLEGIFQLTSLQKLQELRGEKCSLTTIPNSISNLQNLNLLFLQVIHSVSSKSQQFKENEIQDATPILSVSSLQTLVLSRNKLTSFGSRHISTPSFITFIYKSLQQCSLY
jgi:Leucine-rich repeat (LRR) protein